MSTATNIRREILPDDDGSKIFVDFYESSTDDPTVRLDVQSLESLQLLKEFVRTFVRDVRVTAALSELDVTFPVHEMKDVVFTKIEKQSRESSKLKNGILSLSLTPEGWQETCEKIEAITGIGPAVQYLESYRCDVTLELAYKE